MSALHEIQAGFRHAMLFAGDAEDTLLPELGGEAARVRLAAYRRSIMGNLTAALQSAYPVVARVVGLPFFREAARCYVLAHPSASGDLNDFGHLFPDFLAAYPHAASLPWLPDLARLEWRLQAVWFAAEAGPNDLAELAKAGPEDYRFLGLSPAPAHARLDSPWPVGRVWTLHQAGDVPEGAVDFSQACRLLAGRDAGSGRVFVLELSAGEAALFDALAAGADLERAAGAGLDAAADLDLGAALHRFLAGGFFNRSSRHADPGSLS